MKTREFDALIQNGKDSPHRELTSIVTAGIWKRGRAQGARGKRSLTPRWSEVLKGK